MKKPPVKKSSVKKRPMKKPGPLDELLEQTLLAIASPPPAGIACVENMAVAVERAAEACIVAGRADLAATLAAALPGPVRGPTLLVAARGGEGSIDAAIDLVLQNAAEATAERPWLAARGLAASATLGDTSPRASALAAVADEVLTEAFASDAPPWGSSGRFGRLASLLHVYFDVGQAGIAKRVVDRIRKVPDGIADLVEREIERPGVHLLWRAPDDAAWTLRFLGAMPDRRRVQLKGDDSAERAVGAKWTGDELEELAVLTMAPLAIGERLLREGRTVDARRILQRLADDKVAPPRYRVNAHLLLGDHDALKALVATFDPARHYIERLLAGVDTFAEARERRPRGSSSTTPEGYRAESHRVESLLRIAKLAVEKGEIAEAAACLASVTPLTPADEDNLLDCRLSILDAEGKADAIRSALETSSRYDAEMYAKHALRRGHPDLAALAEKQLDPGKRYRIGRIAAAFLPADPEAALRVLRLAGKLTAHYLFGDALLPRLWTATLAASVAAPEPPKKIATAKTTSGAKKSAKSSKGPLTVETLLARTRQVLERPLNPLEDEVKTVASAIEACADACVAAGRADLAAALADTLPELLRGPTRLVAARGGEGSIDAAMDATLADLDKAKHERPFLASRAYAASAALRGKSARAEDLMKPAERVLEEAFASARPSWIDQQDSERFGKLAALLHVFFDLDEGERAKRVIDRICELPSGATDLERGWRPPGVDYLAWRAPDDPEWTLKFLAANEFRQLPNRDSGTPPYVAWTAEQLDRLAGLLFSHMRASLAVALIRSGRPQEARTILLPVAQSTDALTRKEALVPLTEIDGVLAGKNMAVVIAEAREHVLREAGPHGVHFALNTLVDRAIACGELVEAERCIEAFPETKDAVRKHDAHKARIRLLAAKGAHDAVRSELERSFVDRWSVNLLLDHGQADLAVLACKKVPAKERGKFARSVASPFIVADPSRALETLDTLAGKEADRMLRGFRNSASLLPALWNAVLTT